MCVCVSTFAVFPTVCKNRCVRVVCILVLLQCYLQFAEVAM